MKFAKLALIFLAAAALIFCGFLGIILIFRPDTAATWRVFSVCMPLTGLCGLAGLVCLVISLGKGK